MKKVFMFIFILFMSMPIYVKADHIYSIDMNIYLVPDGSAHITEVWDVEAESGTAWCKKLYNLENLDVTNFAVYMDDVLLDYKKWDNDDTIDENAGHYGIIKNNSGVELCFGKSDYERHKFTFSYDIANYIINTDDAQVMYHVLLPKVTADSFFVDVISFFQLSDDLEISGFGYKGEPYAENGRLVFSNYDGMNEQYAAAVVKFPLGTFDTTNTNSEFVTYKDAYRDAKRGGYEYEDSTNNGFNFLIVLYILLGIIVILVIAEFVVRKVAGYSMFEKIVSILKDRFGKKVKKY